MTQSRTSRIPRLVLAALFVLFTVSVLEASAQPRFTLKRTKRETTPLTVQLYGGYNGVMNPSDSLQRAYANHIEFTWGGLMVGMQAMIPLDTLGLPVWIGLDAYYQRMFKRYLSAYREVYFRSDSTPVHGEERLHAYGGHLILGIDILDQIHVQIGGGPQYLAGSTDISSEVVGLFEPRWVFSSFFCLNLSLLKYDHGSIDANFRLAQTFGTFGSLHFQSLLGFTFDF